jgi:hypothetical protein
VDDIYYHNIIKNKNKLLIYTDMPQNSKLTKQDYEKILAYYKKEIPSSFEKLKQEAENILANKLCKCIKKVDPENEAKSIGICSKTIFTRKGLVRGRFKCRSKRFVEISKNKTRKRNRTKGSIKTNKYKK